MATLELKHLAGGTWFIPAPTNTGLYVQDNEVVLIDSGNDKEAGRQINRLIEERGWKLRMIINTHSNADHIGGNAFLQRKTGCAIAATAPEVPFIEHPELEAAFLYGGYPLPAMKNKFLTAKPSKVTDVIEETGPAAGTALTSVPLPGHFFGMIGLRTPDNVLFTADALFPPGIIRKYHIFYLYDIAAQFVTLNNLAREEADIFVPGHGVPVNSQIALIDENRRKIEEIISVLTEVCSEPKNFDTILGEAADHFSLAIDHNQYILVGSTLRSYLAYLEAAGRLEHQMKDNTLVWLRLE